jgi:hypothetical protein
MDYHEICKSLDVGIDVLQKQFVQDASYAQLERMDQLDFQGFVIYLITELLSILKESNEAEIDSLRDRPLCPVCGKMAKVEYICPEHGQVG